MRVWMMCLVLVLVTLAGCTAQEPRAETSSTSTTTSAAAGSTTSTTGSQSTTGTTGTTAQVQLPPSANLTADRLEGTAPLLVNFTLTGEDPEGGNLTWSLSFGDNSTNETGTALPTNVTHTFPAGTFQISLQVAAGEATAWANLTIVVLEGTPAAPFTPIHETHDVFYFCELCTLEDPSFCIGFNADVPGVDCGWTTLPAEAAGRTYTVATDGLMFGNPDIAFLATCVHDAALISAHSGAGTETGTVPPGAGCLVFWDYDGVEILVPFIIDIV